MKKRSFAFLLYLAVGTTSLWGQSPLADSADRLRQEPGNPEARRRYEMELRREQQKLESGRDSNGMMLPRTEARVPAKKIDRAAELETAKSIRASMKMLEPGAEFTRKYKKFLSAKNTGIGFIFPDKDCYSTTSRKVVSVIDAERCQSVPREIARNGSLYSFRLGKNYFDSESKKNSGIKPEGWWDVHFVDDRLVVGNCCTQGIIADLGSAEIETLNESSPNLAYLFDFKPHTTADGVQQQNRLLRQKVSVGGTIYEKMVSATVGHVYALRSVSYGADPKNVGALKILFDEITVFKIVEKNENGSLVLLWRNLQRK